MLKTAATKTTATMAIANVRRLGTRSRRLQNAKRRAVVAANWFASIRRNVSTTVCWPAIYVTGRSSAFNERSVEVKADYRKAVLRKCSMLRTILKTIHLLASSSRKIRIQNRLIATLLFRHSVTVRRGKKAQNLSKVVELLTALLRVPAQGESRAPKDLLYLRQPVLR